MSASRVSPYQFVTLRTHDRLPLLAPDKTKQLLLDCFTDSKRRFKLTVAGYAVLDDHAHFLFSPPLEQECSGVITDLLTQFMRARRKALPLLARETQKSTLFWNKSIEYRSAYTLDELRAYLDFIHYDPLRHGLVERAAEYPWSSLPARIEQGHYPESWSELGPPASIALVARDCPPRQ